MTFQGGEYPDKQNDEPEKNVGPYSGNYPAYPKENGTPKKGATEKVLRHIFAIVAVISVLIVIRFVTSDDVSDSPNPTSPIERTAENSQSTSTSPVERTTESSQSAPTSPAERTTESSQSASVSPPLTRPSGFTIDRTRYTLRIRWQPVTGADHYRVRFGSINNARLATNYHLKNLKPGTTYIFRVRAESEDQMSAWAIYIATTLPPIDLPSNVVIKINERYDDINIELAEQTLADIADWYKQEYGLVAETPSVFLVEPQCAAPNTGNVLGYTRRLTDDTGNQTFEVCARLDEDSNEAIDSKEFKSLLAHEYFHVLQANAGWAFQVSQRCSKHLIEGSAEYFGQIYAWGELQSDGTLDALEASRVNQERYYYYDNGARAFAALVKWKGDKVLSFWESEEVRCSDAFLAAFDVTLQKYESDWSELTGR